LEFGLRVSAFAATDRASPCFFRRHCTIGSLTIAGAVFWRTRFALGLEAALAHTIAIKEARRLAGAASDAEEKYRQGGDGAALGHLFDPGNGAVTLQTLLRAANAIGRGLRIKLV
jgi:hypothetical protein